MAVSVKEIIETYNPDAPLAEASTIPSSWYVDPRILELEGNTVFARSWQMVGRADQVREPGQYITCELAREPILVVRGNDGVLRGFFNVCRHHAATVMPNAEGRTQTLRCPYHGWTYNLDGALIVTPEFAGVRNFNRAANGLIPVQTAIWQSLIFVKLSSDGPSLDEFLNGDLALQISQLSLEKLQWMERRTYILNCNWKVFVDNYLDGGYHVPHLHQGLDSVLDPAITRSKPASAFVFSRARSRPSNPTSKQPQSARATALSITGSIRTS